MKTVGMRGQAAHRMKGHRIAGDGVVFLPPGIGPGNRQFDFLITCGDAHFVRQTADARRRNAGDALRPLGRVFLDPLQQQLECRFDRSAVLKTIVAEQRGVRTGAVVGHCARSMAIPP